jgi:carbonic anhydrase
MSNTILNRYSNFTASAVPLSPIQSMVDEGVTRFVSEAADPKTLAALTAGGLAYRYGKIGLMSLGARGIPSLTFRAAAVLTGLGSEVTAFEFTNRLLSTIGARFQRPSFAGGETTPIQEKPNFWSWSGPGGWKQSLIQDVLTFGLLKGAGFLARDENLFFQHAFQSTSMVAGQQTSTLFGGPRPEGSWAEQFLHAEMTNLQMAAGIGLSHVLSGGRLMALERGLDLSLQQNSSLQPLSFFGHGNLGFSRPVWALSHSNRAVDLKSPEVVEAPLQDKHSNLVWMSSHQDSGSGEKSEAPSLVLESSSDLHMRPSRMIVELLHEYPSVQLSLKKLGSSEEPVIVNPQSMMDILALEVHTGEKLVWRAEGERAEEMLAALHYYNDNRWTNPRATEEPILTRKIRLGTPKKILLLVSHAMDEFKEDILSGIYHSPSETFIVGKTNSDHASIAKSAGFDSILDVSRLSFERMGSWVKMGFPPDDSGLENFGGHIFLARHYPELLQGIDLKRGYHRLLSIDRSEDIPLRYQNTPIARLLEYHNLRRPLDAYAQAGCLIGMCMDNRKMLRLPDRFAFILRAAGANMKHSEFDLSVAVSLGNLSHFALIGHSHCKAVDLGLRRQLYVDGLVRNGGWKAEEAGQYFDEHFTGLEQKNEVNALLKEATRLRQVFPRLHVTPLLYRVEDNRLYLLKGDAAPEKR